MFSKSIKDSVSSVAYAQLSDSNNQQPKTLGPVAVKFNTNDFLSEVEHDPKNDSEKIKIKTDGIYFIVSAGQIGRASGALLHYVDLWHRVNDKDVSNSNTRGTVPGSLFTGDTYVLMSQTVIPLKAGDILNVMFSVSSVSNGIGLIATQPENEPVIPSIIFSLFKIS